MRLRWTPETGGGVSGVCLSAERWDSRPRGPLTSDRSPELPHYSTSAAFVTQVEQFSCPDRGTPVSLVSTSVSLPRNPRTTTETPGVPPTHRPDGDRDTENFG